MQPNCLSIIGVGLLGGSIGLAARSVLTGCKIKGYGHRQSTLDKAKHLNAIDEGSTDLAHAVAGADLVILCTPVGLFEQVLNDLKPRLKPGARVTDVGSTKQSVVSNAGKILSNANPFVGSHPMAGSEKRGIEFARADLFTSALCILTPTAETDPAALRDVEGFWQRLGMRTHHMSPDLHDAALATASHLPHALAAALVAIQSPESLKLAGKGFLDTTRIAGGDGELWRDIFLDNAPNMKAALAKLRTSLAQFEAMLDPRHPEQLAQWLNQTAATREALLKEKLRENSGE